MFEPLSRQHLSFRRERNPTDFWQKCDVLPHFFLTSRLQRPQKISHYTYTSPAACPLREHYFCRPRGRKWLMPCSAAAQHRLLRPSRLLRVQTLWPELAADVVSPTRDNHPTLRKAATTCRGRRVTATIRITVSRPASIMHTRRYQSWLRAKKTR